MLVGKSLEDARIECIEEHELKVRQDALAAYKQKREAALIQTQRMEA